MPRKETKSASSTFKTGSTVFIGNRNGIAEKSNATNSVLVFAVAVYLAGISSALSDATFGDSTISMQRASAIALKARPGVIAVRALEARADVTGLRYSFDIQNGSQAYEVDIEAVSGKVLEMIPDTQNPH